MVTPKRSTNSPSTSASGSGSSGKIVSPSGPCSGRPALGMQCTGTGLYSPRKRIASRMSSGPVEQLRPSASTCSASRVVSTALMSVPSSILPPLGSSETLVWIGTERPERLERLAGAEDRGLDLEDVLGGLDDDEVGAALDEPARLLLEDGDELAEGDLAQRRVVGGGQMAGGPDRPGDELVLADRLAGDLGGALVDLERVLAQAPLLELQARGLEAVGLHDLGARLDHRLVQRLDDVRAVQDQRLVALALQPAVVGRREVVLLERRAHRAVEDDDALARGGQVVAHRGDATRTLTQPCQCSGS